MKNQRDVISATSFGCRVLPALAAGLLRVGGVTSRGLYLKAGEWWTLFLTTERPRGPLTINLGGEGAWLETARPGQVWHAEGARLRLPDRSLEVDLARDRIWLTPEPLAPKDEPLQALSRLRILHQQLEARGAAGGLADLLGDLVSGTAAGESNFGSVHASQAREVIAALNSGAPESLVVALTLFLGLGRGLTPSGDDLILGFLLARGRWGSPGRADELSGLFGRLIEIARQRTTRLGASLIECAAGGEADERLLDVADHVWSGSPSGARALDAALGWGASSGVDALTGMALFLKGELPS